MAGCKRWDPAHSRGAHYLTFFFWNTWARCATQPNFGSISTGRKPNAHLARIRLSASPNSPPGGAAPALGRRRLPSSRRQGARSLTAPLRTGVPSTVIGVTGGPGGCRCRWRREVKSPGTPCPDRGTSTLYFRFTLVLRTAVSAVSRISYLLQNLANSCWNLKWARQLVRCHRL